MLSENVKIVLAKAAQDAATTEVKSDVIDTCGFEGCIFITRFATANADNYIKVKQDTASNGSTAADLAGTKVTSGASDEGVAIDINRPQERYLQLSATRTVSTALGEIWAILYGPVKAPVVSALTGTLAIEAHVSPSEGTA
jgi:hypothetical protein